MKRGKGRRTTVKHCRDGKKLNRKEEKENSVKL